MTAENRTRRASSARAARCFNEAAADDRGKPDSRRGTWAPTSSASMRPRPMTAENRRAVCCWPSSPMGFNEAAADDRGKPPAAPLDCRPSP